jgi:hypothetical protein
MMTEQIWLLKLLLSHLLTDFILQPRTWIEDRNNKHFSSGKLYLHGLITGAVALLFTGWQYWPVALVILVTHTLIDGWKSYQRDSISIFIIDQCLHVAVIILCWYFSFQNGDNIVTYYHKLNASNQFWVLVTGVIFLTTPAGILIGQLTRRWREKIVNPESLANAGKWIGVVERIIVLILVMLSQYAAISLLIAAKGIIRFSEKDRPEEKTEYLVIGTLLSIGIAIVIGLAMRMVIIMN